MSLGDPSIGVRRGLGSPHGRFGDTVASDGHPELSGTGQHLTTLELRAWTSFLDASRRMEQLLARHLVDEHQMSHSEYEILVRLDGAGGSMRLSTLADQCVSSKSRLTHTLDRVEKRGWIRREVATEDRRGINAVLSEEGTTQLAAASGGHAKLIREFLLDAMTEDELAVIARIMRAVSAKIRNA